MPRVKRGVAANKRKNRILHLAGRGALDVDGLGEKLVEQLLADGARAPRCRRRRN